jgi:hypothetical protein
MQDCKMAIRKDSLPEDPKDSIEKIEDADDRRTSECMAVLISAVEVDADVDRLGAILAM